MLLPHKQALLEIISADIDDSDGLLNGICEGVLPTAVSALGRESGWFDFIVLGDCSSEDVIMGFNEEKARVVVQEIHAISLMNDNRMEEDAEYLADQMAAKLRALLKSNQKLMCTSYSTGLAKESRLIQSVSQFIQFWDSKGCQQTIQLRIKMVEP